MPKGQPNRQSRARIREREGRSRLWRAERLQECQTIRVELARAGPRMVLADLLRGNPKGLRQTLRGLRGPSEPQFEDGELENLATLATENLELFAKGVLADGDLDAHLLPLQLELLRSLIWKGEANAAAYLAFRAGIHWERSRETALIASARDQAKHQFDRAAERHQAHLARFRLGGERRRGERRISDEEVRQTLDELIEKNRAFGGYGQKGALHAAAAQRLRCGERTIRRAVARMAKLGAEQSRLAATISGPNGGPNSAKAPTTRRK